jgi:outer membrane receptor protein involved in Fe transport
MSGAKEPTAEPQFDRGIREGPFSSTTHYFDASTFDESKTQKGAKMRNSMAFRFTTLSAAVASALISGNSAASAEQNTRLEEVIVTATRRAQSLQEIPINITSLSSSLIERERIENLSDIARRVPGLTVVDQGPRSGNTLTVRGLTVDSVAAPDLNNNGGGAVATYVGEVPVYVDLRLNDLDRVEVLLGPQGTLYGAGTLAGAIRYIPNKPQTDALSYQLRGDVFGLSHSDGTGYEGGGTLNLPIIDDKLAMRASLDYFDDPGFIDYNYLVINPGVSNPQPDPADRAANLRTQEDGNTQEIWSGRLALRYTGEKVDSTLTYYYQDTDIGGRQVNHRDSFNTGRYESAARFEEPNERKNELLSLDIIADLGFAELTSATGYNEYNENGQRDQTDFLLRARYGYEFFPSFVAFTREDSDEDTFTQELRLVSKTDSPLNWIVGAFYSRFEINGLSQEFYPGLDPNSLGFVSSIREETEETAAFGEIGYDITDAWQVTVGARWFKFDNDATTGVAFPLGDPNPPDLDLQSYDVDDDDVIYKFNTSYTFTDDIMGYFTASQGYRLGGLNPRPVCENDLSTNCISPNEQLIKPDTTTNYELGINSQFGDSLLLNGSIYVIEWDDVRVFDVSDTFSIDILSNGGSARSTGIELSSQWFVTSDFSLTGAYSYNEAELTEDAPGLVGTEDALDGDRLPGTPENQLFLAANYQLPIIDGSYVDFDWSMTYQSNVLTKVGERDSGESLSGFALHNISATWFKDSWSVALYANNVFDKYAETGVRGDVSDIENVEGFDSRFYFHNVVRPRQFGMRFIYNFEG